VAIIGFKLTYRSNNGFLKTIEVQNAGSLTDADLISMNLRYDNNANGFFDAGETSLASLTWDGIGGWTNNSLNHALGAGGTGTNFIITINLSPTATIGSSMQAYFAINSLHTTNENSGSNFNRPGSPSTNFNSQTVISVPSVTNVRINEVRADGAGTDTNEFVELIGVAGVDLTGYQIIHYNQTSTLQWTHTIGSFSLPDDGITDISGTSLGFYVLGTAAWSPGAPVDESRASTLQNGPSDYIVLKDASGNIIDAMAWGGVPSGIGGVGLVTNGSPCQSNYLHVTVNDSTVDTSLQAPNDVNCDGGTTWLICGSTEGAINTCKQTNNLIDLGITLPPVTNVYNVSQVTFHSTIMNAVSNAANNDIIEIWSTENPFFEEVRVSRVSLATFSGNALTIRSRNTNTAISINSTGRDYGITVSNKTVSIIGLTITNADKDGIHLFNSTNSEILYNVIGGNTSNGVRIGGTSRGGLLLDNIIEGNNSAGIYEGSQVRGYRYVNGQIRRNNGPGILLTGPVGVVSNQRIYGNLVGIYVTNGVSNRLIRNVIYSNINWGIHVNGLTTNNIIINNVVWRNGAGGIFLEQADSTVVNNNIAESNTGYGITNAPASVGATIEYNDSFDNSVANWGPGFLSGNPGNISLDALFVNATATNFQLTGPSPLSPAVDAGTTNGLMQYDAEPVIGFGRDMGAIESLFTNYGPTNDYYVNDGSTSGDLYTFAVGFDASGRGRTPFDPLRTLTKVFPITLLEEAELVRIIPKLMLLLMRLFEITFPSPSMT